MYYSAQFVTSSVLAELVLSFNLITHGVAVKNMCALGLTVYVKTLSVGLRALAFLSIYANSFI